MWIVCLFEHIFRVDDSVDVHEELVCESRTNVHEKLSSWFVFESPFVEEDFGNVKCGNAFHRHFSDELGKVVRDHQDIPIMTSCAH